MVLSRERPPRDRPAHPWMEVPLPATRALQVYGLDPSVGNYCTNRTTVQIPWEPLKRGPVGRKVAVVDYDAASKRYYAPVDLDDPALLARQGMDPSESDPRFHQQMVYAVASRTIQMFEVALGRDIHWRRADRATDPDGSGAEWNKTDDIRVLKLYPHAIHDANAYYSPQAHGILFGYFAAGQSNQGRNLPGQRVFTCLSHDIIAHEVTHAIIDGIRTYFTEPTNPDVLAFHEGFADLCALFSHFSLTGALEDAIRRTGGRLYDADLSAASPSSNPAMITAELRQANPLIQLAQQFGEARGAGRGLRSALGTPPNSDDIHTRVDDPHFRGSILVSAVFDAYFSVYTRRADDLFQILRAGGGAPSRDLLTPVVDHLVRTASRTADFFFRLCVRAIDYCPPVDITFGDFLRALMTVAKDIDPTDEDGTRDSLMEAFRLRGIYPESSSFYSEDALGWPAFSTASVSPVDGVVITHPRTGREEEASLVFGGPNGMTTLERDINGRVLRAWVEQHRSELGLDPERAASVPSFHTAFRPLENGRTHVEMIVEVMQSIAPDIAPGLAHTGTFPFRGGATLVINGPELHRTTEGEVVAKAPEIRFVIGKSIAGEEGARRLQRQRSFAVSQGVAFAVSGGPTAFEANFALLHEER